MNPNQRKLLAINTNGQSKKQVATDFSALARAAQCPLKTVEAICNGDTKGIAPHMVQAVQKAQRALKAQ